MKRYQGRKEGGSITIVALVMLAVLTVLGITITRISSTDIQIAGNELFRRQEFYVAEGGVNREAQEVGSGNYEVTDIYVSHVMATQLSVELPLPVPHQVMGETYDFTLQYIGLFVPPAGYSAITFNRYDYDVDAQHGVGGVDTRYYKIGPKAE